MALTKVKAGNIILTTPSASSNDVTPATTQYVTTALANLADSAPSTLNTLNELAAALGDDANFSTTVTNSIATKLPLAGGTMTGTLKTPNLTINDGVQEFDKPSVKGFRFLHNDAGNDLSIQQGDTNNANYVTKFNISTDGNVGIGTNNPTTNLDVYNGSGWGTIHIDGTSGGELALQKAGTRYGGLYASNSHGLVVEAAGGTNTMLFLTNSAERMRIESDGLATFTSTRSEWAMRLKSASSRAGIVFDKPGTTSIMGSVLMLSNESFNLGTASNYHVRMDQSGNTYMGNTSTTRFTQNGNLSVNTTTANSGITSGTDVRALGPCFANDANSFTMSQEGTGNADAYLAARGPNSSTNGNIRIGVSVSSGGGFKTGVRIDNLGRTTTPENPAFRYRATAAQVLNSGWQQVGYGTLKEERGTGYSSANSRFTAPVAGWYQFNAAWTANANADNDGTLAIWINGSSTDLVSATSMPDTSGSYEGHFCGGCCYLDVNDYVQVHRYSNVTTTTRSSAPYGGWFSGFLIG